MLCYVVLIAVYYIIFVSMTRARSSQDGVMDWTPRFVGDTSATVLVERAYLPTPLLACLPARPVFDMQ